MRCLRHVPFTAALWVLAVVGISSEVRGQPLPGVAEVGPAVGPYVGLKPEAFDAVPSFGPDDRVVMTTYFYWYDSRSGAHIRDADGSDALTTHPASLDDFSYLSVAWHRRQMEDMMAAGIDVALPVYWGAPSERDPGATMHWSFAGLPPLVEALDALVAEGKTPPRIGLFYDTSTLQFNTSRTHVDLTTEAGRNWFYASIRDFFSMIPPRHWALIDGRPVVQLYSASFATAHDQACLDDMKARFANDFGGKDPYVIREVSWNVKADNVYSWGGAIRPNFLGIGQLGPGYDHSAVEGREPLIVDRRDGAHYEEAWQKAIRINPRIVTVETWNEFHEGTDIAESREYGRQYIDLTRLYVDRWRSGWTPPPPSGPYAGKNAVSVTLGAVDQPAGLKRVDVPDGKSEPVPDLGRRIGTGLPIDARYLYVAIDDSFKWSNSMPAAVDVEFLDQSAGSLALEYDSHDASATLGGAYTGAPQAVPLTGDGAEKSATFQLRDARLAGLQNGGADFRLVAHAPSLVIKRITVRRLDPATTAAGEVELSQQSRIIVPADAIESEHYAAEELRDYLARLGVGTLPIVTSDTAGAPPEGATDIRLMATQQPELGTDGYRLAVEPSQGILIEGGRPRGVLNGVYGLLEEKLGVRWFTPDCEVVPNPERVALAACNETSIPALRQREVYWSVFMQNPDFAARNRTNGNSYRLTARHGGRAVAYSPFVHTFDELVPQSLYETHPEYFPLIDGERRGGYVQRCLTNPDVLRLSIERVREWIKAHPEVTTFSVSQNDTFNNCQCPNCKAIDDAEGTPMGSLLTYVNAVADAVAADYPNVRIDTLAYQYTRQAPRTLKPGPNVEIRLCSIECCFAHPLDSACSELNRRFAADLAAWTPIAPNLTVWDYTTNFAHYQQPFPNLESLGPNVQFFVENGVSGLFEQGNYSPGGGGELEPLRAYLLAKLLWNPGADVKRHTSEFLNGYYGPAAPAVQKYVDLLNARARPAEVHVRIYDPASQFLDASFVTEALGILAEARTLAGDNQALLQRVDMVRLPVLYTKLSLVEMTPEEKKTTLAELAQIGRAAGVSHISEGLGFEDWVRRMEGAQP